MSTPSASSPAPDHQVGAAPDGRGAHLGVVVVADQTAPAVLASLTAHLVALQQLGAAEVSFVLVDQHPDPAVAELLTRVDGGDVVRPGEALGVGRSWERGWSRTTGELVLLTTAASAPAPDALVRLVAALDDDPAALAAYPGTAAPALALVRRSALQELFRLRGTALPVSPHAVLALGRLRERLLPLGDVVVVPDAQVGGVPLRQAPTTVRKGWVGLKLRLLHPEALEVGPWTYVTGRDGRAVTFGSADRIRIGSYCSIADEVRFVNPGSVDRPTADGEEPVLHREKHRPWTATSFPVGNRLPGLAGFASEADQAKSTMRIGHDVWIGAGAVLLGPVQVGHGAVIGAGAVVTRDVPPYAVVAGNPARTLRSRIPEDLVEPMLRIAWWDWAEADVVARAPWFTVPAAVFVERCRAAGLV